MNLGELRSPKNFRVYSGSSTTPEYEAIVNSLREQCIGEHERIPVPFDDSTRRM
ncbi:hypothetical protein Pmar_PMAR024972, partial [Perkinsus marinus ATCC 50983]